VLGGISGGVVGGAVVVVVGLLVGLVVADVVGVVVVLLAGVFVPPPISTPLSVFVAGVDELSLLLHAIGMAPPNAAAARTIKGRTCEERMRPPKRRPVDSATSARSNGERQSRL
jgi:hypothetical protein